MVGKENTRKIIQCSVAGCDKGTRSKGLCKRHGGGRRCKHSDCVKSDQGGGYCIAHGGGRRCKVSMCPRSAQSKGYCKSHGGGIRCKETGCPRSAQQQGYCRRHISLIEYLHLTSYEDSETYMQEHDVETSNDSVLRCLLAQEQMRNKKHLPGSRTMKHAIHRVDTSTNIVDEDEDTLDSSTTLFSLKKTRNPPERAISEKDMEVCMLLQQLKKKS